MQSPLITIGGVLLIFFLIMTCVVAVAFSRTSNATGIDPAQIAELRRSEL